MSELDTAEYRKLALIAAGVPLDQIPPIIDTATWRRMLIAALIKNTANQVISGSVDYFSQLPTTIGSPAIGATWLVRNSSGIYYINYRSAGVYMKVTDTGSASDWVYIPMSAVGTLPDATISNPQNGQALIYNSTTSRWTNQSVSSGSMVKYKLTDQAFLPSAPGFSIVSDWSDNSALLAGTYHVQAVLKIQIPSNPGIGGTGYLSLSFPATSGVEFRGFCGTLYRVLVSSPYSSSTGPYIRQDAQPVSSPFVIGFVSTDPSGGGGITGTITFDYLMTTSLAQYGFDLRARFQTSTISYPWATIYADSYFVFSKIS